MYLNFNEKSIQFIFINIRILVLSRVVLSFYKWVDMNVANTTLHMIRHFIVFAPDDDPIGSKRVVKFYF
jgi:hypothetical protein